MYKRQIYGPAWAETAGASGPAPALAWSIWLTPKQLHTIIGTAVYFTALFAVCQLGEYVSRKCSAAPGDVYKRQCIFCFIDQMPPGMRETLYFKDDDSRLSFLQGNYITLTNMKERDIELSLIHISCLRRQSPYS